MAHGGKRAGAGKKKGTKASHTIQADMARAILAQMVFDEITPIGMKLIAEAKIGNIQAIKELFDRAFGKAPQAVDITSGGKIIPIQISETIALKNDINASAE